MYPNDNRYPENIPSMDPMNQQMYNNQMRTPSMDINSRPPPYYEPPFYDKNPIMQPVYDYMNPPNLNQPPSMMPMNQAIDPRYSNWRQSSQSRPPMMHPYYQRPSINQQYMHSKPPMPNMMYSDNYNSHDHLTNLRSPQLNILQRISLVIKPQLPQLRKIMSKISTASSSTKKKQSSSRRQKSRDKQRERQRQRSHEKSYRKDSSGGEWVCSKCSFLNFDWRQKCKKCSQTKPFFPSVKNYNPGPQDWKCTKCGNVNYARRFECNRCKQPRGPFNNR